MKIKTLLNKLKKLNLPKDSYLIYGSGPLGIRGIREIHDLDVVLKDSLYKKLRKKYPEIKEGKKNIIKLGDLELGPVSQTLIKNFKLAHKRADEIEGIKFVSLNDLIIFKRKMGRLKDFRDIQLIKNYLKKRVVKKYNKLIRDKILEIIKKDKEIPFWRFLTKKEFHRELKRKILEEAKELSKAKEKKEIINEIIDLQELIDSLIQEMGFSKKQFQKLQKIKRKKRGGFKKRIFLVKIEK